MYVPKNPSKQGISFAAALADWHVPGHLCRHLPQKWAVTVWLLLVASPSPERSFSETPAKIGSYCTVTVDHGCCTVRFPLIPFEEIVGFSFFQNLVVKNCSPQWACGDRGVDGMRLAHDRVRNCNSRTNVENTTPPPRQIFFNATAGWGGHVPWPGKYMYLCRGSTCTLAGEVHVPVRQNNENMVGGGSKFIADSRRKK